MGLGLVLLSLDEMVFQLWEGEEGEEGGGGGERGRIWVSVGGCLQMSASTIVLLCHSTAV